MFAYLVSFSIQGGEVGGTRFGSHVMQFAEPPSTSDAIRDLRTSIALMYSAANVAILNWDYLPNQESHPGYCPYGYYVAFQMDGLSGWQFGDATIARSAPIDDLEQLRSAEDHLTTQLGGRPVHFISCKPLVKHPPTPDGHTAW